MQMSVVTEHGWSGGSRSMLGESQETHDQFPSVDNGYFLLMYLIKGTIC